MEIYWRIDVRKGDTWKTLGEGTGKREELGYGWEAVAEHVFMSFGVQKEPDFRYINTRVCLWPAELAAEDRSLDNLIFVRYHAANDARDYEDSVWRICRELKEWGAILDFGYAADVTGDVFYINIAGRGGNEFHGDEVYNALESLRDGWLAARAQQPDAELHPGEAEDIVRMRISAKYNDDLGRIRAAGGELAAQLETALREHKTKTQQLHAARSPDYAAIRTAHRQFQEQVFALAARLNEDA